MEELKPAEQRLRQGQGRGGPGAEAQPRRGGHQRPLIVSHCVDIFLIICNI